MRTYEALFIVRPDVSDEEVQAVASEVENHVTSDGGAIVRSEIWGKRRLAYEVKSFNEGNYVLIRFQSESETPKKLEQYFRLSESIIRNLVVYFDEHTLKLEAEQIRRNEAELARTGGRPRDEDDRGRGYHDDRPSRDDRPYRDDRPPRGERSPRDDRPPRGERSEPAPTSDDDDVGANDGDAPAPSEAAAESSDA